MTVYWFEQAVADVPLDNDWLGTGEQARLSGMGIAKRRADWRLGRWTAKHAVAAWLNLEQNPQTLAALEIHASKSGAPQAFLQSEPAAVSVSISHRGGIAACAVGPPGTLLGCDLELVEPRSDAFVSDYFTDKEQQLLARTPTNDQNCVVNLLWSAKESALKALGVGLRLNSRSAVVMSVEDLWTPRQHTSGTIYPCLTGQPANGGWQRLQVACPGEQTFDGWWRRTGALLGTMLAYPPSPPPVVL